jgi:signal peptidase complex subunit 2
VILEFNLPSDRSGKEPPKVEQMWSVGQFFDKEGYFDEAGLTTEVEKLFHRLESKKYDTNLDEKKKKQ